MKTALMPHQPACDRAGAVSSNATSDEPPSSNAAAATTPAASQGSLGGLTPELWQLVYSCSGSVLALRDLLRGRRVCRGFARQVVPKALRSAVLDRPLSQADLVALCRTFPHLQQLEFRSRPAAVAAAAAAAVAAERHGSGGDGGADGEEEEDDGAWDWGHWGDWSGQRRRRQAAQQQPLDLSAAGGVWLPELQELTVAFTPLRTCVFTTDNTPRLQRLTVVQLQDAGPLECLRLHLPELTAVSLDGVTLRDGGAHFAASLSAPACPRLTAVAAARVLGVHGCHHLALPACTQLRLQGCEDLRGLRLWAPRLQLLDLSGCVSLSRVELPEEDADDEPAAAPPGCCSGDDAAVPEVGMQEQQQQPGPGPQQDPGKAGQHELLPASAAGLSRAGAALAPAGPAPGAAAAAAAGATGAKALEIHGRTQSRPPALVVDLSGTLATTTTLQHLRGHARVHKLLLPQGGACVCAGGGAVTAMGTPSFGGWVGGGEGQLVLGAGADRVAAGQGQGSTGGASTAASVALAAALAGASLQY